MALFIREPETLALSASFLRISSLATPFMISNFQMAYTLQAMGKGPQSLLLIPLLIVLNRVFGLYGLIWSQPISDTCSLILGMILYRVLLRRMPRQHTAA